MDKITLEVLAERMENHHKTLSEKIDALTSGIDTLWGAFNKHKDENDFDINSLKGFRLILATGASIISGTGIAIWSIFEFFYK